MTDITARLAAIGVTLPEVERVLTPHVSSARSLPGTCLPAVDEPSRDEWLAALAAVVGELERVIEQNRALIRANNDYEILDVGREVALARAEKAEAENERLRKVLAQRGGGTAGLVRGLMEP